MRKPLFATRSKNVPLTERQGTDGIISSFDGGEECSGDRDWSSLEHKGAGRGSDGKCSLCRHRGRLARHDGVAQESVGFTEVRVVLGFMDVGITI